MRGTLLVTTLGIVLGVASTYAANDDTATQPRCDSHAACIAGIWMPVAEWFIGGGPSGVEAGDPEAPNYECVSEERLGRCPDARTRALGPVLDTGVLPPEFPGQRQRNNEDIEGPVRILVGGDRRNRSHQDRGLAERCLLSFNVPGPIIAHPTTYNSAVLIVQTNDTVTMKHEMAPPMIVRVNGTHAPSGIRSWHGDAIASWEGETLVVERTNFNDNVPAWVPRWTIAIGSASNLRLTERFTLEDEETLKYEYEVDVDDVFPDPFKVTQRLVRISADLYEYACHEGNYSLSNILRGARVSERLSTAALP